MSAAVMDFILSAMIFVPFVGMLVIAALPRAAAPWARWIAAVATALPLGLAGVLFASFDRTTVNFQFTERYSWIPTFDVFYFVGVDGLSITMVLLATFLSFLAVLAAWNVERARKGHFALLLLLAGALTGVFVALDFVLFLMFWELTLLPLYLLIGIWGSRARERAALKFLLFAMAGSMVMLLAIFAMYFTSEPHTFDMTALLGGRDQFSHSFQYVIWLAFFFAFAIKVPLFPFHTWVPQAHAAAPTAVSMLQAGVLLKIGAYGLLRVNFGMLPLATADLAYTCLGVLGVVNIVYGGLCAMGQTDLKKLVAYSSVSHMGFVVLGMATITRAGMDGAVLHMFSHGVVAAMLMLIAGILEARTQQRRIDGMGGLASAMPVTAVFAAVAFFAALGLPGLAVFMSEIHILSGAWQRYPGLALVAAAAVVFTAGYLLSTWQRIFLGPISDDHRSLADLDRREVAIMTSLAALLCAVGVYPRPLLELFDASLGFLHRLVLPHL